jgi:hypothetical protein
MYSVSLPEIDAEALHAAVVDTMQGAIRKSPISERLFDSRTTCAASNLTARLPAVQ